MLRDSTGASGNIVVVVSKKLWQASVGEAIENCLMKQQSGLPQPEPYFDLTSIDEEHFNNFLKYNRTVLLVDIAPENTSHIEIKRGVWAKGQLVIRFQAPDAVAFVNAFESKCQLLKDSYNEHEIKELIKKYGKYGKKKVGDQLRKNHDISLIFAHDYEVVADTANVFSAKFEGEDVNTPGHQITQGVIVNYYEYENDTLFSPMSVISAIDTVSKYHIHGPVDGSYMKIAMEYFVPEVVEREISGRKVIELRGLWDMEGYKMGGPFVSHTVVDEKNSRIVTVFGYVYAPNFNKREYLRQVEAIIHSLELP